jgi:hypothetical protein
MKLSKEKIKELTGQEIEDDFAYIEILNEKQYKSRQQNALFHSLLSCFWDSGCSSFESYKSMRFHYKDIAHLIEYVFTNDLKESTKQILWRAVKVLPIEESERKKVIELLKGKTLIEHSWAESTKGMAKIAIDQLLNDMHEAGVNSKKFEEILKGLGEWYESY